MKRVIIYQEGIITLMHLTIEPWIYEAETDGIEKRNSSTKVVEHLNTPH